MSDSTEVERDSSRSAPRRSRQLITSISRNVGEAPGGAPARVGEPNNGAPRRNIPALTGIRGAAALLVLLFHLPSSRLPLIRNGYLGVDLFFILSGFILMHVHQRDFERPSWSASKAFLTLRFLRVYPLHFSTLLLILVFVIACPAYIPWARSLPGLGNAYSFPGFFQTLTLTNRIGLPDLGQWNGPSWSLSSEALGYMFFPVLALLLNRARSRITCWFTALALLGALSAALYAGHSGVIRVMLAFPAGMALGRAFHLQPVSRFHANILAFASCAVALVSLGVDILKPLSVFGFAGLIYSLATDQGPLTKLLSSPAAMFIGTISFSLYLTHQSLFMFLSWWQGDPHGISILLFIAAALLVATAAYRLVEAPSHRFARANVARLRTRDQTFERLRESEPLYSQP